jgi:hypothetical protein
VSGTFCHLCLGPLIARQPIHQRSPSGPADLRASRGPVVEPDTPTLDSAAIVERGPPRGKIREQAPEFACRSGALRMGPWSSD